MSDKQVSANVNAELDEVLCAVRDVVVALKAGKNPLEVLAGEFLKLSQLLNDVKLLPAELSPDLQNVLHSAGLRGGEIVLAALGKYQP